MLLYLCYFDLNKERERELEITTKTIVIIITEQKRIFLITIAKN